MAPQVPPSNQDPNFVKSHFLPPTTPPPATSSTTYNSKTSTPITQDTTTGSHRLKVLIAGGNIQGLVLALILHRLNVDVLVLERAHSQGVSPGSIVMGSFAVNLLEMLEILAPIAVNTQELHHLKIWDEYGTSQAEVDFRGARERYGYNGLVVNTRELQTTLRDQLPGHCVLDGKSVVDYVQDADGVTVWCADGSCYRGAILVGCDGRNSTVRRILYEQTQELPEDEGPVPTTEMDRNLAGMTNVIAHDELIDPTTNECIFRQDWGDSQVIIGRTAPFTVSRGVLFCMKLYFFTTRANMSLLFFT